jgi:hypothetical protein
MRSGKLVVMDARRERLTLLPARLDTARRIGGAQGSAVRA